MKFVAAAIVGDGAGSVDFVEDIDLIALARELMLRGDWPVHAVKALDLFPADYAWQLKRREGGLCLTSSF